MLKLIDVATKGNLIRLYFGEYDEKTKTWAGATSADEQPYGDDWNDAPYEDNAGTVYDCFIKRIIDVFVKWEYEVTEPSAGRHFSREELFDMKAPFISIITNPNYWYDDNKKGAINICAQDSLTDILDKLPDVGVEG